MSYLVVFHPLAEKEFREAYQWYEDKLPGLGESFERSVAEQVNFISQRPYSIQKKKVHSDNRK